MPAEPSRREQILQALAEQLQSNPGQRITTAALAQAVGVSEAALYRHFPSKAKMFEGLIAFIEDALFTLFNRIAAERPSGALRLERVMRVLLGFAGRNPGLCRLLSGDALTGENERLRTRIGQLFERVEMELRQVLREARASGELSEQCDPNQAANLLLAYAEGRIGQFVRSGFRRPPTEGWEAQWALFSAVLWAAQSAPSALG